MKICVLLGGASPERMVSLSSGTAIAKALKKLGHEVLFLDPATPLDKINEFRAGLENISMENMDFEGMAQLNDDIFIEYISYLKEEKVDLVFNALHGGNGENGVIAGMLEKAVIPYTGSGYEASALAMDKYKTKVLARYVGVNCAEEELHEQAVHAPDKVKFPLVIKPNDSGSSVGLSIIQEPCDIYNATAEALKFSDMVIIEDFIPGREFDIPVVKGEAYPILEVNPHGVNDYKAKYMGKKTEYKVPAPLSDEITKKMQSDAVKVYMALGLKNYARIDFRMTADEKIYLLEANTLPGMTASSLVPKSAKAKGIDFPKLLTIIIEDALA
ncbi:MAG: D-alanine--D-alanine ligase [Candidatus Neomarinimicrobiota bacterium]|nr:MAG: D-alanine--D-alanine ligase [Candidatus Neomarinimicrobiota bacterium]